MRQVEIRAAHMQEQKAEYGRVMASYQTLQENLQAADDDRRRLEAEKGQLNMEIERLEKERGKSEQNLKVATLTASDFFATWLCPPPVAWRTFHGWTHDMDRTWHCQGAFLPSAAALALDGRCTYSLRCRARFWIHRTAARSCSV